LNSKGIDLVQIKGLVGTLGFHTSQAVPHVGGEKAARHLRRARTAWGENTPRKEEEHYFGESKETHRAPTVKSRNLFAV